MTIQIRIFNPTDSEFVLSLVGRFSEFDLPGWRSNRELDDANRASLHKSMQETDSDSVIFIAENESGARAGFIHLQTQADYFNGDKNGYVSDLSVEKSFEGRGIGSLLLAKAEEWARQKGYRMMTLYVFANNTRARRLYEKRGFEQEVVKYAKTLKPGS